MWYQNNVIQPCNDQPQATHHKALFQTLSVEQRRGNTTVHTHLDGFWLASVDGHAYPQPTKYRCLSIASSELLGGLRVLQDLGWPGQREQAMLHIKGPGNGVYGVMECHGECVALSSHLKQAVCQRTVSDIVAMLKSLFPQPKKHKPQCWMSGAAS